MQVKIYDLPRKVGVRFTLHPDHPAYGYNNYSWFTFDHMDTLVAHCIDGRGNECHFLYNSLVWLNDHDYALLTAQLPTGRR